MTIPDQHDSSPHQSPRQVGNPIAKYALAVTALTTSIILFAGVFRLFRGDQPEAAFYPRWLFDVAVTALMTLNASVPLGYFLVIAATAYSAHGTRWPRSLKIAWWLTAFNSLIVVPVLIQIFRGPPGR